MIRTAIAACMLALAIGPASAQSTLPAIPIGQFCTVPILGKPQRCRVWFWGPFSGISVEVASQADGERLIATLIENNGRAYEYETGVLSKQAPRKAGRKGREP
jgi:hypothetical protein